MAITGIDHVLVAVPALDQARAELQSLGFTVTPKATHQRFGTANHLVVLEDAYLEAIAIENPSPVDPTSQAMLAPAMSTGGGVSVLALATSDAGASHRALMSAGVEAADPLTWSRAADTPEGPRTATFTTMWVRSELLPEFTAFFCQHHNPECIYHPTWQGHANGARRLVGIRRHTSRGAGDLERALRNRLGAAAVQTSPDGSICLTAGPHRIEYAPPGPGPSCEITLAVRSIEDAAALLGGRALRDGHDGLRVPLACARGAQLRFVEDKQHK